MTIQNVKKKQHGLVGTMTVPGDKSISHRAVMMDSMAKGKTVIDGFLPGEDCIHTIHCFRKMGVNIVQHGEHVVIEGNGI